MLTLSPRPRPPPRPLVLIACTRDRQLCSARVRLDHQCTNLLLPLSRVCHASRPAIERVSSSRSQSHIRTFEYSVTNSDSEDARTLRGGGATTLTGAPFLALFFAIGLIALRSTRLDSPGARRVVSRAPTACRQIWPPNYSRRTPDGDRLADASESTANKQQKAKINTRAAEIRSEGESTFTGRVRASQLRSQVGVCSLWNTKEHAREKRGGGNWKSGGCGPHRLPMAVL